MSPGHPSDAWGASRPKHLEPLGPVTMRKMMGGATLYLGGIVFAIMDEGEIWFKADAESDAVWDAEGCERFSYTFDDGRTGTMNYRRAPADAYDDPEAMQRWAKLAHEAALRGAAKKKPKRGRAAFSGRSERRRRGRSG
ncbi:MAG TPA: TfoX/Sxy family protein [Allosphingosinicella sp.]|nr:TfoX/Sxy family protein [Allosphingosinicella sp.]